jgi:phosphoenolpyruvate-protein phosphotransferase (PTS system enzyme I)
MMENTAEVILKGSPICRGIAIGNLFFLNQKEFAIFEISIHPAEMQREIERFRHALTRSKQDIKRLQKQLEIESANEGVLILEAQLEILQDPLMTTEIEKEIVKKNKNADFVFQQALQKYEERFLGLDDPFFVERFNDLRDLSRRVFSYLQETENRSLSNVPAFSIVCANELSASDAASAQACQVSAFVTEVGGATTHAAIVAKAKGIPYIADINFNLLKEFAGALAIIDGTTGRLILNPQEKTLEEYRLLSDQMQRQFKSLKEVTKWPAQTFDGHTIRLCANLDMSHEIDLIHELGGQGIGLFRSEYIFLPSNQIPTEEEQYQIYSRIIERMNGLPVVIRTFDLGGDKIFLNQGMVQERNHFLGCRATRFLLKEKDLFKSQLRAILRASVKAKVSILFPMISTLMELRQAKEMIEESRKELNLYHPIPIGCMIEVPSAALIIDHFVKECDFFSIGTNDLVQYALAVDRCNQESSEFNEPFDPSVIRLIKIITSQANKAHLPVSVCGEMASDPRFTALLIGLGIQELSVAPRYLPLIKHAIRRTSITDAVRLAEEALSLTTSQEVLTLLMDDYRKSVPEDLFFSRSL